MKVLKRGITPDGINIQIEDWSKDYSCFNYGSTLVAYPKDRYGEKFRCEIDFDHNSEAEHIFNSLINGHSNIKKYKFVTLNCGKKIAIQDILI